MTDTEKMFLLMLAEIKPERFQLFLDEDHDGELWQFDDSELHVSLKDDCHVQWWMSQVLESLPIAYITKLDGYTWDESILNAIVHYYEQEAKEQL